MPERKYSISEIDRMRASIRLMYPTGVSFSDADRARETEERLRTYMANGTEPEELEEAANAAVEQRMARIVARRLTAKELVEANRPDGILTI